MKVIFLTLLACSFFWTTNAQLALTGYVENVVGINYTMNERFDIDYKVYANLGSSVLPMELSFNVKALRKPDYNFFVGLGVEADARNDVDFFNAIILPFGFEIKPFDNKKLAFVTQLTTVLDEEWSLGKLVGIRYYLR